MHTDAFGRIKVQFHWDREGQGNDRSSCWIRHAELWAGRGFGTQFVPRVGMEVVVTFLGGDVDRPLVTGCVANAVNRAPFQLPEAGTRSGVKTRSSPNGGGHNELSFEDRKGSELVHLRAERELDVRVGTDQRVGVGNDRSVMVAGRDALDTGDRLTKVRRDDDLEVEGRRSARVFGESEEHVVGNRALRVDGTDTTSLLGGSVLTVEGPSILRVTGEYSVDVGTGDDAGAAQINVSGSLVLGGSRSLRLVTQGSLTLSAGESSIEIDPEGIRITAGKVEIAGAQVLSLSGKGPTVSLGEEAEIAAGQVRILSSDAALELGEDASLWGRLVKLNCSRDEPRPAATTTSPGRSRSRCSSRTRSSSRTGASATSSSPRAGGSRARPTWTGGSRWTSRRRRSSSRSRCGRGSTRRARRRSGPCASPRCPRRRRWKGRCGG
ncbi:type VI secretion system tip protein TssI/VgrG [Sorangium sp. So ce388]|uniref:type VI secretion system Vgr family protein n=1 Tax=Sorangium sp. So ce388 TaxID=3133309 RepID=UPI003F5BB231